MSKSTTETFASIASGDGNLVTHLRQGATGFLGRFSDNIAESGRNPVTSVLGFALAWGLFFFVLFALPIPHGLSPAGKACLAVVMWACVIWVSEAIPVGITGILIPMLLVMSGAAKTFNQAV